MNFHPFTGAGAWIKIRGTRTEDCEMGDVSYWKSWIFCLFVILIHIDIWWWNGDHEDVLYLQEFSRFPIPKMTWFQLHKHLKTLSPSLKHNLGRGVSATLIHPEKGSESFFKTESAQILRDKLCKFAQSNSHRDWFVFKNITSPLIFHQRATDICLNINIAKNTPFAAANPGLLEVVRVFTWVTYGNFQPTKVLMNIFYVRCQFGKAWNTWNAFDIYDG